MGLRFILAKGACSLSTFVLKTILRRPAAYFPGKLALRIDPEVIAHLSQKMSQGSVVVCGTNGKTTVTNLLADIMEAEGKQVICNRTGANLSSGVAAALLQGKDAEWGVFESDELWLATSLPQLQSKYLVLLNLFRDQLDRVGEINVIQDSIVSALNASPDTVVLYNADDPFCAAIVERVSNTSIAFGIDGAIGLKQNTVADAQMCQMCSDMLQYNYRQYGQLGEYFCPNCGFSRAELDYAANEVSFGAQGLSFMVHTPSDNEKKISANYNGAYMVYNLLSTYVAAHQIGVPDQIFDRALQNFDPQNGRLQSYTVAGKPALLNLAKNPTGFNQNLSLITQDQSSKVVAFFVNDKEGDGRDVSWLWDVDFEELAAEPNTKVFAGGIRKNDLQVRLKYAGIDATLIQDANEVLDQSETFPADCHLYFVANYTALSAVHAVLEERSKAESEGMGE